MRIGIDIDDTITDSWPTVMKYMCKDFNKDINEVIKEKITYERVTNLSFEDYLKYSSKLFPIVLKDVKLKENVLEVLTELFKNNEIYFITARLDACYGNAYQFSKDYLDRKKIPYTKIIANNREKDKICKKYKIDLLIDDSRKNCESVSKCGIPVIMFENYFNSDETRFKKIKNWNEILDMEELCKKDYSKIAN